MISNSFVVSDYYELLALHRALLEAKFCDEPNDLDVSASPILAESYRKLISSLINMEVERKGKTAQNEWADWLKIGVERREWRVGLQRARNERLWKQWSLQDKRKYVYDLLAPFTLDDELVDYFISQV